MLACSVRKAPHPYNHGERGPDRTCNIRFVRPVIGLCISMDTPWQFLNNTQSAQRHTGAQRLIRRARACYSMVQHERRTHGGADQPVHPDPATPLEVGRLPADDRPRIPPPPWIYTGGRRYQTRVGRYCDGATSIAFFADWAFSAVSEGQRQQIKRVKLASFCRYTRPFVAAWMTD